MPAAGRAVLTAERHGLHPYYRMFITTDYGHTASEDHSRQEQAGCLLYQCAT